MLAGLASGAVVALALLTAFVAFVPDPGIAAASPSASASAAPAGSPGVTDGARSDGPSATATGGGGVAIGEPAPALRVPQLGGGEIDLANLRGQPVWIAFIATDCEPCLDQVDALNDFSGRYGEAGLIILAIDVGEDESLVAAFAQSAGARFPIGLDVDRSAAAAWSVGELPLHVWLGADGVVRFSVAGPTTGEVMAQGVRAILPGVVVTP